MALATQHITNLAEKLPKSLSVEAHGPVLKVTLCRPEKRNALDLETVKGLETVFTELPAEVSVVVLTGDGDHFCAGLDLEEAISRGTDAPDPGAAIAHSQQWHRAFSIIERGPVPVVSVLKGAVIGGGLELAAATHIRVAESSTFYALPEARHGIFVGGGASVRVSRLLGVSRMTDLMLTGRRLSAEEGMSFGLSQYVVDDGTGLERAMQIASTIAQNARWSNFAILQSLPRIAEANPADGLYFEALTASFVQLASQDTSRIEAFLGGQR